jgi:DNA-binding NtrC family response regulator
MSTPALGEVLVADGDPAIRSLLSVLVKRMARRAVPANDCGTALELIATHDFDGAVIDLRLPCEQGTDVLAAIAERAPDQLPRVVVITTAKWRPTAELAPVAAVLQKPFALDDLTGALQACCRQSQRV